MNIVWSARARGDVDDIVDYIAEDNPSAALAVSDRIDYRVDFLSDFPESGRPGRNGRRELIVTGTPYIVFYRLKRDRVEILAVMHGARNR